MKTTNLENQNRFSATPFILMAFALLLIVAAPFASVNPKLQLQSSSLSESPVQPGHTLALTLHIKSLESDNCADRVAVQLAVAYPLSIQGSDTQYVSSLCYADPDANGTFTFLLPVDNLAQTGTYSVSVLTTYEKRFTKFSESNTLSIRVGGSPSFTAGVSSSNPVDIYAGDDAQVSVTFQNTGPSTVQSARASATSSGIEVKWAGADQTIGSFAPRASATATFTIEAAKNLAPGNYPLDVQLNYVSEDMQNGTSNFHFIVPIKPKADFSAQFSSTTQLHAGAPQEVNMTITNTGTEEARKLKVRIRPLFPFSTDGTVRYVESLLPGQSVNLTYVVTVDKDATAGSQLTGLLMDFEDPQGKKFSDSADFAMPVRVATFEENIQQYLLFIYIGVAVVALIILRKIASIVGGMMKKKDSKK